MAREKAEPSASRAMESDSAFSAYLTAAAVINIKNVNTSSRRKYEAFENCSALLDDEASVVRKLAFA
jgi:hypothetical protein